MITPDFLPGQLVEFEVIATLPEGVKAAPIWAKVKGFVCAIRMASDTEKVYLEYGITQDLPAPYHYGKGPSHWLKLEHLTAVTPP